MLFPSRLLVALECLSLLVPVASANELEPLFTSPVFGAGIGPNQIAVADFDADGVPDAATANYGPGNVSVLLGNGSGGFLPAHNFPVGQFAIAIAAGDLNRDGHVDLVVGKDGASTIAVLLGDGAGGFGVALQVSVENSPRSVALGDLNGDSLLDVVAANIFSSTVSVLLGDGAGGFGALTSLPAGVQPSGLVVMDLDADGAPEIATSNFASGTITVQPNLGAGVFDAPLSFVAGSGPSAIAAADLNGDGLPELMVSNQANVVLTSTVSVLLNQGALTFAPRTVSLVGPLAFDVQAADLDRDGDMDLLAASGQSGVSVLLGEGTGLYPATVTYPAGGGSARSMASGRFDGNAASDIAFVRAIGVGILLDNGSGGLQIPFALADSAGAYSVAAGDLDGDGHTDLVAGIGVPPTLKTWLGDGAGGFSLTDSLTWPAASWDIALADVDRDGRLDIVSADAGISVALGLGDGLFAAPVSYAAPFVSRLKVGRLGDDAWPDVAGSVGAQGVVVLRNDGMGGFLAPISLSSASASTDVALGDLDHDGRLDVIAGHLGGSFCSLWTGTASGFSVERKLTVDAAPHSVWVADFDGDGDDDLAAAGYTSWTLSLRRSDGAGAWLPLEKYTLATNAWTLLDGDFDGDNSLDLAVGNAESGSITVLRNRGGAAAWFDLGQGLAGSHGKPTLEGASSFAAGSSLTVTLGNAAEAAATWLVLGADILGAPFKGGLLVPTPLLLVGGLLTDSHGDLVIASTWPADVPAGTVAVLQAWTVDAAAPVGFAASNGLELVAP